MSYSSLSVNGMFHLFIFLIHGYLSIFANTKIYVEYRVSQKNMGIQ